MHPAHRRSAYFFAAIVVTSLATGSLAAAGEGKELEEARKLFAEALNDEQAGELARALEKFEKVRSVKETPGVEFRIATCLKGLGRTRQAYDHFEHARDLAKNDPKQKDVLDASQEKMTQLEPLVPKLVLRGNPPEGTTVTLDGDRVEAGDKPLRVDPGKHVVTATANHHRPFQAQVQVSDGMTLPVDVVLEPENEKAPPAVTKQAEPDRTAAWILVGTGAALVATSGVVLVVRQGEIGTINDACPSGACPRSKEDMVNAAISHARTEGVVAAIAGGLGAIALGAGIFFLLQKPKDQPPSEPANEAKAARARGWVTPTFALDARGGAVGLGGAF